MKIKNIKAFTLVEVLAVIVVLGILLLIAVPSATKYIENSKRKAFFTSVSNIVNKIKPENLIEEKDFCMYNYSVDKENQTENIDSMYVLAHKENDKIIYSVYAQRTEETVDINIYDFNTLNINEMDNWIQKDEKSYSSYLIDLSGMLSKTPDLEKLSKYKVCGIK